MKNLTKGFVRPILSLTAVILTTWVFDTWGGFQKPMTLNISWLVLLMLATAGALSCLVRKWVLLFYPEELKGGHTFKKTSFLYWVWASIRIEIVHRWCWLHILSTILLTSKEVLLTNWWVIALDLIFVAMCIPIKPHFAYPMLTGMLYVTVMSTQTELPPTGAYIVAVLVGAAVYSLAYSGKDEQLDASSFLMAIFYSAIVWLPGGSLLYAIVSRLSYHLTYETLVRKVWT